MCHLKIDYTSGSAQNPAGSCVVIHNLKKGRQSPNKSRLRFFTRLQIYKASDAPAFVERSADHPANQPTDEQACNEHGKKRHLLNV